MGNCPLPCHGLSFLKVSEGLPAGAVGNMSDYCFFVFFSGMGNCIFVYFRVAGDAYFYRNP